MAGSRRGDAVLSYPGKGAGPALSKAAGAVVVTRTVGKGSRKPPNLLIHGDNERALQALAREFRGEVTLVYIDPPFATNRVFHKGRARTSHVSRSASDAKAYDDTLVGPLYLEFMRRRLVLLRDLLSDRGTIYLHIDTKVGHYLKVLMDEVFGAHHFISDITRVKSNPKNFDRRGFGNVKDVILVYSKSDAFVWNGSEEKMTEEAFARLFPKTDAQGRKYTTTPLHAPGETKAGPTGQAWRALRPPAGRHWRYPPAELERLDKAGLIEWSSTGNPRKVIYAEEKTRTKKRQDIWQFKDAPYPEYPTEKNLEMLKTVVAASSNPGDLVLDCFAGSGTTLVAAEQLGRRWIGVDESQVAIKVAVERLSALHPPAAFAVGALR